MRMPVGFLGHGSPMNAIADNSYTKALNKLAEELPRPKAILVVSAHWVTRGTFVSCADQPLIIRDFYGFPQQLYTIEYPCPGAPEAALRTASLVHSTQVDCRDDWGIDHAAWSVLRHVYPAADVPVYEMSLDVSKPPEHHFRVGQELRALREEGVWVVGSGNVVHNLAVADFGNTAAKPFPWAVKFDGIVRGKIAEKDFQSLVRYQGLDGAVMSVPTNEHYLPLLYVLGTMDARDEVRIIHEEIQNASVSMLCFMASGSRR